MSDEYVVAAHIERTRVTAVCAEADGPVRVTVTVPTVRSVAFDTAVIQAVGRACAGARVVPERLRRLVVGVSSGSLRGTRMLRHVPGGRYWPDVLATTLEFALPVPAVVRSTVTLAAGAEAAAREPSEGDDGFLLVRAGREVEAGLFRAGSVGPEASFVPRRTGDARPADRLADLVEPLVRTGRPGSVVICGSSTRHGQVVRHQVPTLLLARGVDVPLFTPSVVRGDQVLAGALLLARGSPATHRTDGATPAQELSSAKLRRATDARQPVTTSGRPLEETTVGTNS